MNGTNITGRQLAALKGLPKLERLSLQGCKRLRDDAAGVLGEMKQLRAVDLKDSGVSAEAAAKLRTALPRCEVLW
jgi:hypothetical protein